MAYKIYRESRMPGPDWDTIKTMIMEQIDAYKHRKDRIYHDSNHLWFWHNETRKRVKLEQIKTVQKAGLHGFGAMINIIYRPSMGMIEDGKPVDLHLVDVAQCKSSPEQLAKQINIKIAACQGREKPGRRVHKFPGHEQTAPKNTEPPQ